MSYPEPSAQPVVGTRNELYSQLQQSRASKENNQAINFHWSKFLIPVQDWHHMGGHGHPTFWPPFKEKGDIFKARYACTSDSSLHFNIAMVSAVLALDVVHILDRGVVVRVFFLDVTADGTMRKGTSISSEAASQLPSLYWPP